MTLVIYCFVLVKSYLHRTSTANKLICFPAHSTDFSSVFMLVEFKYKVIFIHCSSWMMIGLQIKLYITYLVHSTKVFLSYEVGMMKVTLLLTVFHAL